MKALKILLLTLSISACSIEPTNPNEPNNQNEPCEPNCTETPNDPNCQPTEPNYQTCPEVSACDGVEADCYADSPSTCAGVAYGSFACGELFGLHFSDGTVFLCEDASCAFATAKADQYCYDLRHASAQ